MKNPEGILECTKSKLKKFDVGYSVGKKETELSISCDFQPDLVKINGIIYITGEKIEE